MHPRELHPVMQAEGTIFPELDDGWDEPEPRPVRWARHAAVGVLAIKLLHGGNEV